MPKPYPREGPSRQLEIAPETGAPPLIAANRHRLAAIGEIPLYLRMDEFRAKVHFVVVTNMAVTSILGTAFIDLFVKCILPGPRLIHIHKAPPVAILGSTVEAFPRSADKTNRSIPPATATNSTKIHVAKTVLITPMSEAQVQVRSDQSRLCFLQNHPKLARKNNSLMANAVMDIVPRRPFRVLISIFSDKPICVHKNTVVGLALASHGCIFCIQEATDRKGHESESSAKESEGKSICTALSGPNKEQPQKDTWRETVHIGSESSASREKVIELLSDFEDIVV